MARRRVAIDRARPRGPAQGRRLPRQARLAVARGGWHRRRGDLAVRARGAQVGSAVRAHTSVRLTSQELSRSDRLDPTLGPHRAGRRLHRHRPTAHVYPGRRFAHALAHRLRPRHRGYVLVVPAPEPDWTAWRSASRLRVGVISCCTIVVHSGFRVRALLLLTSLCRRERRSRPVARLDARFAAAFGLRSTGLAHCSTSHTAELRSVAASGLERPRTATLPACPLMLSRPFEGP